MIVHIKKREKSNHLLHDQINSKILIQHKNNSYRGVMDESGEQFVAYFLPLEETLEKRRRDFTSGIDYTDDEEYEYKMAREYNWNVKSKASKGYEENYFLVMRQDGVYYTQTCHKIICVINLVFYYVLIFLFYRSITMNWRLVCG